MAWLCLVAAGVFEIGFTTCLKMSGGFSKVVPSLLFVAFAGLSFWLLTRAMSSIPLGTAYAVWTGIGAAGTAVVGFVWFKDPMSMGRVFFLVLLIGAVVGLKLVSGPEAAAAGG